MLNDQNLRDNKPDLATTLAAVQHGEQGTVTATVFYGLSQLNKADIKQIQPVWDGLDPDYRRKLLRRLVDISEANFDLDYHTIGMMALKDADTEVREAGVDLLFEDMSIELLDQLIEMAQWDDSTEVRAAAASALGRFILAGELEELPERDAVRAQDVAINLLTNEDEHVDIRRRALEAISNSSHEIVEESIREAYESDDHKMRVSSIFAMGRSCDPQWGDIIIRELDNDDAELQYEAARAAGELEVREAVPLLVRLALGSDREVKEVAIWSLGEIGGSDAMKALNTLVRQTEVNEDEDLLEAVEDAIANASLMSHDPFDDDF